MTGKLPQGEQGELRTGGRVLCMTSNFPRWAGDSTTPFLLHKAQDLRRLGWTVDVLAPHSPGAATEEDFEGVHVHRFRYLPPRAETVCYEGGALVNLRKKRSNYLKLPSLVGSQLAAAVRLLRTGTYDLLHTHWALPQGFTGALAARACRVPHVLTVHGEEFFSLTARSLTPFKRYALYGADVVTANSAVTAEQARRVAPRIRELRHIPTGVTVDASPDPALVASLRRRHRNGSGPLLLFIGRLVEEKGVEDAIHAVDALSHHLPDVRLLVGGAGQDREALEELTRSLRLSGRVVFLGFIPARDQPSYYAAADVFLAPSRRGPDGWLEGQGITPLEAMTMGTPVVATRLGGYAETITHERTALAVPERSPGAIAEAVRRLVDDPGLGDRLVREGSRLARERYSRSASAEAFSKVYEEVLARRRVLT